MIDAAVIFGANRSNAEREMLNALQFEMELAKVFNSTIYCYLIIIFN